MGDAKRRGTREQRIVQSIAREAAEKARKKAEAEAWWASLTPEQREEEIKALRERENRLTEGRKVMAALYGLAASAGKF